MNIQVKKHSQSEHTRKKGIHSLKLGGGGGGRWPSQSEITRGGGGEAFTV